MCVTVGPSLVWPCSDFMRLRCIGRTGPRFESWRERVRTSPSFLDARGYQHAGRCSRPIDPTAAPTPSADGRRACCSTWNIGFHSGRYCSTWNIVGA